MNHLDQPRTPFQCLWNGVARPPKLVARADLLFRRRRDHRVIAVVPMRATPDVASVVPVLNRAMVDGHAKEIVELL